jgi:homopolymeric O-antigen transport system permease protein
MNQAEAQTASAASAADLRALELPVERVIAPAKRRLRIRDLLRERAVIGVLAGRDFKVKYKQSMLGPLWLVFQPLALLAAFFVAFRGIGDVQTSGVPYAVFALSGLAIWAFFQASMTIGAVALISNYHLIRFTPCPRPAFPIAGIIASLPSFVVTAAGALTLAAVTGHLSIKVLLAPIVVVWLFLLTAGLVMLAAAVTVRYRDLQSALPFLLQVGVFLAPVGYAVGQLSDVVRGIVYLNPLTGIIEAWRWMVLSGYHSSIEPIAISLVMSAVLVTFGWWFFTRLETTMADDI